MKKEILENINSELFNSFNPNDELVIVGGTTGSVTGSVTFGAGGTDGRVDGDADFGEESDEAGR